MTGAQRRAAELLSRGHTQREVARLVDRSERTIRNWLRDVEGFREAAQARSPSPADADAPLDIRARLIEIAGGGDHRAALAALKELRTMDADAPAPLRPVVPPDAACPSCRERPVLQQPVVHERGGRFYLLADVTCPACGACLVDENTEMWLMR